MNDHLIADLGRFVDERCVRLRETPGHVRVDIDRFEVWLSVLIPRAVLEWWVEAEDRVSGTRLKDCCSYDGYDAALVRELAEDMRADVVRFIENAVARPLRVVASGAVLQWNVGGEWVQAIPLVPENEDLVWNARIMRVR